MGFKLQVWVGYEVDSGIVVEAIVVSGVGKGGTIFFHYNCQHNGGDYY